MTKGNFVPVCKNCGKRGTQISTVIQGTIPPKKPMVSGNCPAHPSGKPNMPHNPEWIKL